MDNVKQSELSELRIKLIKDIRTWKPNGFDAADCFTMLHDYDEAVKKLTIPVVSDCCHAKIDIEKYCSECANEL